MAAQVPYVFYYYFRIEFLTCFSHAADVKYSGKDTSHKKYDTWVCNVALVPRIWQLPEHRHESRKEVSYDPGQLTGKVKLFHVFPGFFSCGFYSLNMWKTSFFIGIAKK